MPQKARNADYTKEYNQKAVLRHLRRQAMSRAELARAAREGERPLLVWSFDRRGWPV